MSKRSHFTTVTALPAGITRETVLTTLHAHTEMIDLNPLVLERHPIRPPPAATAEEAHCQWYSISDKISYLPGVSGSLTFQGCFHDLPDGLQTRVIAPMGLDMQGRWKLGGSLPGEPRQPQELGLGVPKQGLWLKEDVDMKCNFAMTSFVRKTTKKAHSTLVDRLIEKSHLKEGDSYNAQLEGMSIMSSQTGLTMGGDSAMPPGYDQHHLSSSDTGGLTSMGGGKIGNRTSGYSHVSGGSDSTSPHSRHNSQHGTPNLSNATTAGANYAHHPAFAHNLQQQQQQQQQQQGQQQPTSYPPDIKHPYTPDTAYTQQQPQPQPPQTHYQIDPSYQHGQSIPIHHPANQPITHNQPADYLSQRSLSQSQSQEPNLFPRPLSPSKVGPGAGAGAGKPGLGLAPPSATGGMNFAVELPGGEARTPTELGS